MNHEPYEEIYKATGGGGATNVPAAKVAVNPTTWAMISKPPVMGTRTNVSVVPKVLAMTRFGLVT